MAPSSSEDAMPAPRLTTDEYLRTPETLLPQELVYGFVRDAPAPAPRHQSTVLRFVLALVPHLEATGFGQLFVSPIDVVLDAGRDLVVQPDIIVISRNRLHIVADRVRGAPDLAIEVLSPAPRIGRLDERLSWFAQYGVRECWLARQPQRTLEVLTFARGAIDARYTLEAGSPIRSQVLPGFASSLDEIAPATGPFPNGPYSTR
jgi:Uma2 family endonuclease